MATKCPEIQKKGIFINGVEIKFPYERPYPSQKIVMSKVISALKNKENALLESPTGTGSKFVRQKFNCCLL